MKNIIKKLNDVKRAKSEINKLAEELNDFKEDQYNTLIENLISNYEGPALSKILIVSAINEIKVDPALLARSFKIADNLIDVYFPYKFQDASAIPFLLEIANDMTITWPPFALNPMWIAIELSLKFSNYKQELMNTLVVLAYRPELELEKPIIADMIKFLKKGKYGSPDIKWKINLKPLKELPERENITSYGDQYGNEIPFKFWEMGKMDPATLKTNELVQKLEYAIDIRFIEKAYDFLGELQSRNYDPSKLINSTYLLYYFALVAKDLELVNKIQKFLPEDFIPLFEEHIIDIIKNPHLLNSLEDLFKELLLNQEEIKNDGHLIQFYNFIRVYYPAFSIILYRAIAVTSQTETEIIDLLQSRLKVSRIRIGLEPEDDPIKNVFSAFEAQDKLNNIEKDILNYNGIINDLKLENSKYHTDISQKRKEIRTLEKKVANLNEKLKGTLEYQHLKKENETLKMELADKKRELKNYIIMIKEEKEKNRIMSDTIDKEKEPISPSPVIEPSEVQQDFESNNLTIPEFKKAFFDSLNKLDTSIAIKAVTAVTAFSMRDQKILSQTDDIQALPDYYRIKFDENYRLMIHWIPGKSLTILDVISRQSLEKWISNKKNSATS